MWELGHTQCKDRSHSCQEFNKNALVLPVLVHRTSSFRVVLRVLAMLTTKTGVSRKLVGKMTSFSIVLLSKKNIKVLILKITLVSVTFY